MQNLNFEDGVVELTINNDPNKIIRFNPTDLTFVERYYNIAEKSEKLVKKYNEKQKASKIVDGKNNNHKLEEELLRSSNKDARDLINSLFGQDGIADVIFGRVHPLSPTQNGKTVLENFLEAITVYIKEASETFLKKDAEKIEKYKQEYDRFTS